MATISTKQAEALKYMKMHLEGFSGNRNLKYALNNLSDSTYLKNDIVEELRIADKTFLIGLAAQSAIAYCDDSKISEFVIAIDNLLQEL